MSQNQKTPKCYYREIRCVYPYKGASTLKSFFEDDAEEEFITFEKMKPGARERARGRSHVQAKPVHKTSYESSADV